MKISRFVNNLRSGKVHTSGYADASSQSFGAASAETFSQRQAVEYNRQHVGAYTQSTVVGGHRPTAYGVSGYSVDTLSDLKTEAAARTNPAARRLDVMRPTSRPGYNSGPSAAMPGTARVTPPTSQVRHTFTEPRSRSGGPYSAR